MWRCRPGAYILERETENKQIIPDSNCDEENKEG